MTWGLIILYYSGGHGHGLGIDMENSREAGDGRASKFRAQEATEHKTLARVFRSAGGQLRY